MTILQRFAKQTDALELKLRGVTYTVEAGTPLEARPEFVRLEIRADDGRSWTVNLGDGRGLSPEDRAAMAADHEQARAAQSAGRL